MSDLFEHAGSEEERREAPLADRMRPRTLEEFSGQEHLAAEQAWPALPPKELSYPLDELIERIGGQERPAWVLKKTRKALQPDPSQERLAVGCSGCFETLEAARRHAASIVARKIAWFLRQKYVNRSREYERACGWNNGAGDLGYDNWQLGYTTARRLFTEQNLSPRPRTQSGNASCADTLSVASAAIQDAPAMALATSAVAGS